MNYIKKLQAENAELKGQLSEIHERLIDYMRYYNSDKFHGTDNDFAHVTTDVYPRLSELKKLT